MSDLDPAQHSDGHSRAVGRASLILTVAAPVLSMLGLAYVLILISISDETVVLDELPLLLVTHAASLFALIAGAVLAIIAVSRGGAGRKAGIAALWILGVIVVVVGAVVLGGVIVREPF